VPLPSLLGHDRPTITSNLKMEDAAYYFCKGSLGGHSSP